MRNVVDVRNVVVGASVPFDRPLTRGGRVLMVTACIVIFAATMALHFLGMVGFSNDQYVTLAGAQQMLFGDWPTRDFLDPGLPLAYAVSAGAQLLAGRNLYAETMLTSVAFGFAAALTIVAARRLSGALVIAIAAAIFEVAIFPRGYSYPKMVLYAAGPLVIWWYLRRPSLMRMAWLAAFLQVAFLFRHDHGVYIGIGAGVAVVLADDGADDGASLRRVALRLCAFGAWVMLTSLPYLVYLGVNGGVMRYFARGLQFSAAESAENGLAWPVFDLQAGAHGNFEALLFYVFLLLPFACAGLLLAAYRDPGRRRTVAAVAPLIAIAIVANHGFLRDELSTRLADAIVPAVLLSAWLVGHLRGIVSRPRRLLAGGVVLVAVVVLGAAVVTVGQTMEQLDRASLFGGLRRLPERWTDRSAELRSRLPLGQMPPGPVRLLIPFFSYLDRCTTPRDRLLLLGFVPEVSVWAHRPFAGGRYTIIEGFLVSPGDRQFMLDRLAREVVPFAIVTSRSRGPVLEAYPELAKMLNEQFAPLASYPYGEHEELTTDLYINRTLTPLGLDQETGWPCFL